MTGSTGGGGRPGDGRFLAPISGLLAVVFAVMAGASLSYALSRPPDLLVVPAVLAAASVGCILLKRRLEADPTGGDGDGDARRSPEPAVDEVDGDGAGQRDGPG